MNLDIDFDTVGKLALGGLIVLTCVLVFGGLVVRELWRWARGHLATFDQIQAVAKGGKVQLGATIEDLRVKPAEPPTAEVIPLDERRGTGSQ